MPSPLDPSIDPTPPDRRRTARELLLVAGGRGTLLAAWFVAGIALARSLGIGPFGAYLLCQAAIKLAVGCVGDPLDMSVMREAPTHLATDRPRAVGIVRAAFWSRVVAGLTAVLAAAGASVVWPAHGPLLLLTGAGVLGDLLLRSVLGYLQLSRTFGRFLAVDAVWELGRAAVVLGLVLTHTATAATALLAYVGPPYAAFAVGLCLLPRDVTRPAWPARAHVVAVLRYARWMAAASAMSAAYEVVDRLLLGRFGGDTAVGVYGAGQQLASVPDFLDGFVQTVLSPRVAPARAAGTFGRLQRAYLRVAVPATAVAAVAALILGGPFVRTFLSADYAAAVPVFRLLVLGTLFNLAATPLAAALVNYAAPRRATALTAAGLAATVAGGLVLIPRYGPTGAAALIFATRLLLSGVTVHWANEIAATAPPSKRPANTENFVVDADR